MGNNPAVPNSARAPSGEPSPAVGQGAEQRPEQHDPDGRDGHDQWNEQFAVRHGFEMPE
jgi:hypothetical protein